MPVGQRMNRTANTLHAVELEHWYKQCEPTELLWRSCANSQWLLLCAAADCDSFLSCQNQYTGQGGGSGYVDVCAMPQPDGNGCVQAGKFLYCMIDVTCPVSLAVLLATKGSR